MERGRTMGDRDNFVIVTDADDRGICGLVLLSVSAIVDVRPLGNPISDGAKITLSNGKEMRTTETFDALVTQLHISR